MQVRFATSHGRAPRGDVLPSRFRVTFGQRSMLSVLTLDDDGSVIAATIDDEWDLPAKLAGRIVARPDRLHAFHQAVAA